MDSYLRKIEKIYNVFFFIKKIMSIKKRTEINLKTLSIKQIFQRKVKVLKPNWPDMTINNQER